MVYNNYTSIPDAHTPRMHGNWSGYTNVPRNVLSVNAAAFIQFIHTFPVLITNTIFNSIYAFGIMANIVLLVYLIYYKRYKMPVFCVILSLGVADLSVCLGGVLVYSVVFPFILGPVWLCNVANALLYLSYLVSNYHIALFAVLRFIQLVYPLTSHSKVTTSRLFKICLTIWIAHAIQTFVIVGHYEGVKALTPEGNPIHVCSFTGNRNIFHTWLVIVWFLVPFISTTGIHLAKQVIVLTSKSATVTSQDEGRQQVRRQTDSRALAFVIVTYLITICPYIVQAIRVYLLKMTYNPMEVFVENVFLQIAFVNSAINPWIYLFAAESVRSDVKTMLRCK